MFGMQRRFHVVVRVEAGGAVRDEVGQVLATQAPAALYLFLASIAAAHGPASRLLYASVSLVGPEGPDVNAARAPA